MTSRAENVNKSISLPGGHSTSKGEFPMRTRKPANATVAFILVATCLSVIAFDAVPVDATASPGYTVPQGAPAAPVLLEASSARHGVIPLPATWEDILPLFIPTAVAETLTHVGRCVMENVTQQPLSSRGESGTGHVELIPRNCPLHVSMSDLNPGMYQDLVDEACGDSGADMCIVVGTCKLTKQYTRSAGSIISVSETFCRYDGCMYAFQPAISAVEATFMSADDR